MDDHHIIALYVERDENAIRETEKKYGKLCMGISKNILHNIADAEECVNDTYLGVWNAIPPQKPKSLMAFVARIARNLSLKRLEYNMAAKRSCPEPIEFSELEEVLPDQAIAADCTEEDLGALLNDFLKSEKEDARNVFIRKYWYFDPIEEIAERFSFSESKVKSMLFHTRSRLKEFLKEKGVHI